MTTSDGGEGEGVRILIVDATSGEVLGDCRGAVGLGECPQAGAGERVPCAGRRLVPQRGTGAEGWSITVSECQTEDCPLGWLPARADHDESSRAS